MEARRCGAANPFQLPAPGQAIRYGFDELGGGIGNEEVTAVLGRNTFQANGGGDNDPAQRHGLQDLRPHPAATEQRYDADAVRRNEGAGGIYFAVDDDVLHPQLLQAFRHIAAGDVKFYRGEPAVKCRLGASRKLS